MKILVTGGAGFIGSNLVRLLIKETNHTVINIDKLTYAGNLASLNDIVDNPRYVFTQTDLCDLDTVRSIFKQHRPDAVIHLAAESHVDRSIDGPGAFVHTNIFGTYNLLEAARGFWSGDSSSLNRKRFLHVSTDEVFGSLEAGAPAFTETTPYAPHSPYSASKAASDHIARAWHDTFGLPIIVTNCSNNYGPYQFPEKLIPVVILKCLSKAPIPVYGNGENIRDWLYVGDHCRALLRVLENGTPGQTYNIGGNNEQRNIDLVRSICRLVDEMTLPDVAPREGSRDSESLITFVHDRPGHDLRYAIDSSKIQAHLGWKPRETAETGMRKTVQWYIENHDWWEGILRSDYKMERLGRTNVDRPGLQAPLAAAAREHDPMNGGSTATEPSTLGS